MAYYDVTTFSFESVSLGELRMFGYSKDHKHNEVQVVMGLLMDNQGIPISYQLFPGNTMDQSTLAEAVKDLKKRYQMDKIVVVADRGLNSKDNLAMLVESGHDFVMSYSLKKAPENIRQFALESGDWEIIRANDQGEVVYQSKVVDYCLKVKVALSEEEKQLQPKKSSRPRKYKTIEIPVQIHVTWEASRARKDWKDRQRAVEKAQAGLDKPGQLKASLKRGRNQYITFDIDTEDARLDEARIENQARYDGYYATITNQLGLETLEVTTVYGGLWEIEETFRVLKSDLRARPVYVWTDEHVRGHFALCFLSLCLMRYIQYQVREFSNKNLSCEVIGQTLYNASAILFGEWPLIHLVPNNISEDFVLIQKAVDMPPLLTVMTRSEFKRITQLDIADNYPVE